VGSNTDERCFIAASAMVNNQMVINGAEMMLIYGDLSCLGDKDWSLGSRILGSGGRWCDSDVRVCVYTSCNSLTLYGNRSSAGERSDVCMITK